MPILGDKIFKLNDGMNIDDDDEDEKQPLAVVKQKYSQSNSPSPSKSGSDHTPDVSRKTPRAVIARPPTSHGSKKNKSPTNKAKPKTTRKPLPVFVIEDSSSSDDEPLVTKVISPPKKPKVSKLAVTPKKNGISPKTPKKKTPNTKPRTPSSPRNPFSSPNTMKLKRFQIFCNKLEKLWEAKTKNPIQKARKEYNSYAHVVVTSLQRSEIERISNESIRADILKRYETHTDRKKMESMTEEEKNKYMKQKLAAHKQRQKEKELNEKKRFEDTGIILSQPLPSPKPVAVPAGFEGCNYGDILAVINFVRSYSALLTPKEDVRLVPDEFANALIDGENGYPYLAKILLILLHTLIHDEEASFRKEMGVRLSDLELNSSTVGELIRLCLRKQHDDGEDDDEERSKSSFESSMLEVIDDVILEEISGSDFADLSPAKKLQVLVALCNRILSSVAVENYLIDILQQHADAATERNAAGHEYNKLTKETKQEHESKPSSPAAPTVEEPTGDEEEDIASKVKKRRLMAEERAKKEAEERAAEDKRKEKVFNEYKIRNRYETACKKLDDIGLIKKAVMRMEPLGTDRFHSRYWYFGKWLPVVFVEKGWTSIDENSLDQGKDVNEAFVETTFPKRCLNAWFTFESVEELEKVSKALCIRGIRESKLKERLDVCISEIKTANEASKIMNGSVAVKDYSPLPEDFKTKLVQLEASIRSAALGGVAASDHFDQWKNDLENCVTLAEMGEKLIQVCSNVQSSFLGGILAPEPTKRESDPQQDTKVSVGMHRWRESVRQCKTWSRLHVLMSMLRSLIRWDRSVENAKCKICRRKQDDDLALLCDSCNDIYHTYCLRPPLKKPPVGEWFCLSCKPRPPPRAAKQLPRNVYVDGDEDEDEEEEEEESHNSSNGQENESTEKSENCVVCGEGEYDDQSDELIVCIECSMSFHLNCHAPPLRHRPRNAWRCHQCVTGRKVRSARLRDKMERGGSNKPGSNATKASASIYNSDLFDDEGSSVESDSERGGRRKRS